MVAEEIESQARGIVSQTGSTVGRLVMQVSGTLAKRLLAAGFMPLKGAAKRTAAAIKQHVNSGQMSEKRLQRRSGTDIHQVRLDQDSLKEVAKSLRHAGVDHAIEQTTEGDYFLHFQGKDLDHVQHAVNRAFEHAGLEIDPAAFVKSAPTRTVADRVVSDAEKTAQDRSTALMPERVEPDAPTVTMRFNTVEWDPEAKIISDNLDDMGVPFTQEVGPGSMQQSFTFAQPYAPAVHQFVDAYSEKVDGFDRSRVENYDELARSAGKEQAGGGRAGKPPDRPDGHVGKSAPTKPTDQRYPAGTAMDSTQKGRKELIENINKKTEAKLAAATAAPKPIRAKGKSK